MAQHRPWYSVLYVQVLIAIALGIFIGRFFPKAGVNLKPLGDGFVALIRMMIAPVDLLRRGGRHRHRWRSLKQVGRVGVKALIYFEVVSTLALVAGILIAYVLRPGGGFNIDPATLDPQVGRELRHREPKMRASSPLCWRSSRPPSLTPSCKGDVLQVLFISILFGFAIARIGSRGEYLNADDRRLHESVFWRHPHHRARRADRRVRRHGLHRRHLRRRLAVQSVQLIGTFYLTSLIFVLWSCWARSPISPASRSCASSPTSRTSC